MKKVALSFVLSFLTIFALFAGVPQMNVQASGLESGDLIQQDQKTVTITRVTTTVPAPSYFYDNGVYRGYLSLVSYTYSATTKKYTATYSGTVSNGAYPIPTISAEEQ